MSEIVPQDSSVFNRKDRWSIARKSSKASRLSDEKKLQIKAKQLKIEKLKKLKSELEQNISEI